MQMTIAVGDLSVYPLSPTVRGSRILPQLGCISIQLRYHSVLLLDVFVTHSKDEE